MPLHSLPLWKDALWSNATSLSLYAFVFWIAEYALCIGRVAIIVRHIYLFAHLLVGVRLLQYSLPFWCIFVHCSMPSSCSHSHILQLHHHLIRGQNVVYTAMYLPSLHAQLPFRHMISNCLRVTLGVHMIVPVKNPSSRTCQMISHPAGVHLISPLIAFGTSELFYAGELCSSTVCIENETHRWMCLHSSPLGYLNYYLFSTKQCWIWSPK